MKLLDQIALILVVIGGLNWGLVGFFKYNLVESILGQTALAGIVYMLVGLAAVYTAIIYPKLARK